MAVYDNLPVFKATYDLLLLFIEQSRRFQRDFRYTIGQELKKELMDLCVDIYQANASREKNGFVAEARKRIVIIKLNLRVLHDMKQLSTRQFALCADQVEGISRQLASWSKYLQGKNKTELRTNE